MFDRARGLAAAYRATDYIVRGGPAMRIGQRTKLPRAAVFITACNPFGCRRPPFQNVSANRRLHARFGHARAGIGRGWDGAWPAESSLLLTGLRLREAAALGRRLRQVAIVYVPRGRPAELVALL